MPQSVTQYRRATGNHVNWSDKQQGSQKKQNERLQQLAAQPGNHAKNRGRQQTACAAVQLLSVLSSLQNTHIRPAITPGRADRLAAEERMAHADNLYREQRVERAINREVMRNAGQNSRAESAPKTQDGSSEQRVATSLSAGFFSEQIQPENGLLSSTPPAFVTDKVITPSGSGNSVHSASDGSIFSTMLSPVVNALSETGQFISRHDPLRFPGADASALSASASHSLPESNPPQTTNRPVNRFLLNRGFIHARHPERVPLIKTLNAVAEYLEVNPDGLTLLAGNMPGGKVTTDTGETRSLSEDEARIVLYRWLSNQVLGMDVDRWLAEKMAGHALNEESTVGELEHLFTADAVLPHNQRHLPGSGLKELWHACVRDTFPLFAIDSARNMLLHDIEWGLIHAGSLVLKEAGLPAEDIDVESATFVGNMYLALLQEDSLPEGLDGHRLFRLKALVEYARRHPEEIARDGQWDWEHITERADRELLKAYEHHQGNNVVARFNKTMSEWKTRKQVIEKEINIYNFLNPGRKQYTVEQYMNENFRPNSRVKDKNPPFILPVKRKYASQTSHVADCFAELDKPLVTVALASLEENESAFIQEAEVKLASARLSMPRPSANAGARGWDQLAEARQDAELLPNVDLFAACRGNEERIYALKGDNGSYTLHRVDRDKGSYCLNGLMTHWQDNNHPESHLSIFTRNRIKSPSDGLAAMVDNFVQAHREAFYTTLYEQGYEKTTFQKIRDFLPSLIPFYDCTKSLQSGDSAGASISCTLDVIAFIPALGEMASLAGRFASSAVGAALRAAGRTALNAATRDAVQNGIFRQSMKSIGREALHGISVPTKSELLPVGKAVLQGIDPGVELLVDAGKLSKLVLLRMSKQMRHLPPSLKKLVTKLETDIEVKAQAGKSKATHTGVADVPEPSAGGKPSRAVNQDRTDLSAKRNGLSPGNPADELFNGNPCPGARVKRSLEELCKPPAGLPDGDNIIKIPDVYNVISNKKMTLEMIKLSTLKKSNPLRYEIVKKMLSNQIKVSDAAVLKLSKMSDADLVKFVRENIPVILTEDSAAILRGNIKETNAGTKVFYNDMDKRVVIGLESNADPAAASYIVGKGIIVINEKVFMNPSSANLLILLHESSHAIGTKDYMYFTHTLKNYPTQEEYAASRITEVNKEIKEHYSLVNDRIKKEGLGFEFKKPLEDLFSDAEKEHAKKLVNQNILVKETKPLLPQIEKGFINSADTVAYMTILLSGITDKSWFKINKVVLDDLSALMANPESLRNFPNS